MQANPLIWNAVLLPDGTVQPAAPPCVHCHGTGSVVHPALDSDLAAHRNCPACHGSGHGPHWRIVPTAGMLVLHRPTGRWEVPLELGSSQGWPGRFIIEGDNICIDTADCTPIAPPPSCGLSLRAALALLPGAEVMDAHAQCIIIFHKLLDTCTIFLRDEPNEPAFAASVNTRDTAPLRLALQRHDAIQAYIAGWQQEGK